VENIELRSPEIHEILTRPSKGIVSWGSGILFIILLIFLIGSYLFKYPDFVDAKTVISTENPPVWLTARSTAAISELYVNNLQQVEKGQLIAVLENPAAIKDVLFLKNNLIDSTLYRLDSLVLTPYIFDVKLDLGELQSVWTSIVSKFTEYYLTASVDNFDDKKRTMEKELLVLEANRKTMERKKINQKKVFILEQDRFERGKKLYEKGIISSDEIQLSEQNLLNSRQLIEEIEYNINCIITEKSSLIQNIDNETLNREKALHCQEQAYYMSLKEMVSALESWEQTYILTSPVSGKLSFPENTKSLQQVQSGDKLFAIIPDDAGRLQAYLKFSSSGSGKVKIGQKVQIKIDGFPYMEFGAVSGTISSVSLIANSAMTYSAIATIPDPLLTNYGKPLNFRGELTGSAQIHTEELRLIERIINPLKYLLKSQGN